MHSHERIRPKGLIPALSFDFLTPIYDLAIRATMPESTFRNHIVSSVDVNGNESVLDIGCGTGTMALMLKQSAPRSSVFGLDGDLKILKIASKKFEASSNSPGLIQGVSSRLPFSNDSLAAVVSTLMLHHLPRDQKVDTFDEVKRVLRPGGGFHIVDFGLPHTLLMRLAAVPWQHFDGAGTTADNVAGTVPKMLAEAGFVDVRETAKYSTLFGTLRAVCARKARSSQASKGLYESAPVESSPQLLLAT